MRWRRAAKKPKSTAKDFDQTAWVELWTYRLTPRIKFGADYMTVPARYLLLNKILSDSPVEYRRKLFGYDVVVDAPDDWYEMVAFHNLKNITRDEWAAMSIEERGKHLAYLRLSGMIAVIERHTELQAEEKKRVEEQARNKDGKRSQGQNRPQYASSGGQAAGGLQETNGD